MSRVLRDIALAGYLVVLPACWAAARTGPQAIRVPSIEAARAKTRIYLRGQLAAVESEIAGARNREAAARRIIRQEKAFAEAARAKEREAERLARLVPNVPSLSRPENVADRQRAANVQIEDLKRKIADLQRQIDAENDLNRRLRDALVQADAAKKALDSPESKDRAVLLARIALANRELAEAEAAMKNLAAILEEARRKYDEAVKKGTIVAMSAGHSRALFIECRADGLTIYRQSGGQVSEVTVPAANIEASEEVQSVGKEIAKSHGAQVVNFLVRPGGVKSYDVARGALSSWHSPWTSVPITAAGKVEIGDKSGRAGGR